MADYKLNNYTLIELVHFSYLLRDSLEYCHPQINVTEENFDRRRTMSKNMLAEGNFIQKWLTNHPNDEVKKMYPQLVNYFRNVYEEENYVLFDTRKVEPEKSVDFIEETIKNYQVVEDILKAFNNEYKKTAGVVDQRVERCLIASMDYYRVICNWLFFNEIIKNDNEYKRALKASDNKPSYEVNYNLNILKRLIGGYSFNKQRYAGDKLDIKAMLENTMKAFKALDGTLYKEHEEAHKVKLTQEETQAMAKEAIEGAAQGCVNAIRLYEPIWRETYAEVVKYMQENPLPQQGQAEGTNA
jgi:hypothetical protein